MTFVIDIDTTPYHHRPQLLDLLLATVLMVLFMFCPGHMEFISSKEISELLICLTTRHISTV